MNRFSDAMVGADARQGQRELARERARGLVAEQLPALLAQGRAERVLYRLHRARYRRTMRRIAALIGLPEDRHTETISG